MFYDQLIKFNLLISLIPCIPKIMVQTDNGILSELGFMGLLGVVGILSELGFMGLLGVVGRNIFSFEWIEVVIFLTMYKISSCRSH